MRRLRKKTDQLICLPEDMAFYPFANYVLVIASSVPAWIVLYNEEIPLFEQIRNQSIEGFDTDNLLAHGLLSKLQRHGFFLEKNFQERRKRFQLHITNRCNLRCSHCYVSSGQPYPEELTYKEWCELVDVIDEPAQVSISGGEPFLVKWLPNLARYIKEKGHDVAILTNGLLWNEKLGSELASAVDVIAVSIDGATQETHEQIRGAGTFRKTFDVLQSIHSFGIQVVLNVTVRRNNSTDLRRNLYPLIKQLGFEPELDFSNYILEGRASMNTSEVLNISELREFLAFVSRQFLTDGWEEIPIPRRNNCGYGQSIAIYANGDVSPCLTPRFIRGNIQTDGVHSLFSEIEKQKNATSVDRFPVCRECDMRYLCGGKCHLDQLRAGKQIEQNYCDESFRESFRRGLIESFFTIENARESGSVPQARTEQKIIINF